jgi:hypothetical protein
LSIFKHSSNLFSLSWETTMTTLKVIGTLTLAQSLVACTLATLTPLPPPPPTPTLSRTPAPFTVSIHIEPIIAADLGDRVLGPATIYVDAPGAARVEVYLQPVEGPFSQTAIGDAQRIGSDNQPADGFAVAWNADEPYFAVKLYARAFRSGENAGIESNPIWILLDWRQGTATAEARPTAAAAVFFALRPLGQLTRAGIFKRSTCASINPSTTAGSTRRPCSDR